MTVLVAALAGSAGALARYIVSGAVQRRVDSDMPLGTAAVNLSGAFVLGLVAGGGDLSSVAAMSAAGFLGGFTTFSTWMVETVRLGILPTPNRRSLLNLVVFGAVGVVLAALGYNLTN